MFTVRSILIVVIYFLSFQAHATSCEDLSLKLNFQENILPTDINCTVDRNPLLIELISSNNFTQKDEELTARNFNYIANLLNQENLNQISQLSYNSVAHHILLEWKYMHNFGRYHWDTYVPNSWKTFSLSTKKSYLNLVKRSLSFKPNLSDEDKALIKDLQIEARSIGIDLLSI